MAIYYIDPHTTTNGTGTWASPWSLSSSSRTTFADGDEIRIKGVALTDLLTATVYTATYTSHYQLTITAGGGLGADFALYDVVYLPDVDAFAKVVAVASNVISLATSSSVMPWYNTSAGQTAITVRRVNLASYGGSSTGSTMYVTNEANRNNITISDCWTGPTTRVTDGSVKTLIQSSGTGAFGLYFDGSNAATAIATGRLYDVGNTHIVAANLASGAAVQVYILASGVTCALNQLCGTSPESSGFYYGSSSWGVENVSVMVKHLNNSAVLLAAPYGKNISVTATYASSYYPNYLHGGSLTSVYATGVTLTFGDIALYGAFASTSTLLVAPSATFNDTTINFNGLIDNYDNNSPSLGLAGGLGTYNINFGSGFQYKYNRRNNTTTSTAYRGYRGVGTATAFIYFPTIPLPSGWTTTSGDYYFSGSSNGQSNTNSKIPIQQVWSVPSAVVDAAKPWSCLQLDNLLVTHRNGDAAYELLGIFGTRVTSGVVSFTNAPVVTTDAAVFRTAGPSLKTYLATRNASFWYSGNSKSVKAIKIPVTAGTPVTVSGYIRTDQTTYVNGDCKMAVYFGPDITLGTQSMTTACINAWEAFSISFTPTLTGEATLCWEMYFSAGSKSYWLDDLTIS